jgi:hypothetical protein
VPTRLDCHLTVSYSRDSTWGSARFRRRTRPSLGADLAPWGEADRSTGGVLAAAPTVGVEKCGEIANGRCCISLRHYVCIPVAIRCHENKLRIEFVWERVLLTAAGLPPLPRRPFHRNAVVQGHSLSKFRSIHAATTLTTPGLASTCTTRPPLRCSTSRTLTR